MRWLIGGLCALALVSCSRTSAPERAVAAQMLDPESAQFRDVVTTAGTTCGQINGKNALGGYVGFQRFVHTAAGPIFEIDMQNYLQPGERWERGEKGIVGIQTYKAIVGSLPDTLSPATIMAMSGYCEFRRSYATCHSEPLSGEFAEACNLVKAEAEAMLAPSSSPQ